MMRRNYILIFFLKTLFLTFYSSFHGYCSQTDTITSSFSIREPDFLVSGGQVFKLGFFRPENTTHRYLAIYYVVSENTPIWIANRDNPLTTDDAPATAAISSSGNLVLIDGRNQTIWSTNATSAPVNTRAIILDSGNLVLSEISTGDLIWESFSYPTHVLMPAMTLTEHMNLTSWKSPSDPTPGNFTSTIEPGRDLPQACIRGTDGRLHYRSGPWSGFLFMGIRNLYNSYNQDGVRVGNDSGIVFVTSPQVSFLTKTELNISGNLIQTLWEPQRRVWVVTFASVENECDLYSRCGSFGLCHHEGSPICSCLRGFEPVNGDEWSSGNWTGGCRRRTGLGCGGGRNEGDGFLRMAFVKVPDLAERVPGRNEDECRASCLGNCWCLAYSHDRNIGCMFWRERLVDIQQFETGVGAVLYVRVAASELGNNSDRRLVITIPVVVGVVFLSIGASSVWWWMAKKKGKRYEDEQTSPANPGLEPESSAIVLKDESDNMNIDELPLFSFNTLADATNQFHYENLLGRGGFGYVYKGRLPNGKEIAVKRLSVGSGQGMEEFMNEAKVISKVQHRNLVKLLGCCVHQDEKMLVYECMPNKSLDICLFDPSHPSKKILDWKKRFSIIQGIGRGLLYLHTDSRLKIIHRDLKPSNVLLDEAYNPKISDFGMARIFRGNQEQGDTTKVVGTYGYLAPEYAVDGRFSEKSDVYSFGVLMLEIISGKKNTHYYNQEWSLGLLGCAWKYWNENNTMAFVDETIASPHFEAEYMRCMQIALLCVQEFPKDRPSVQVVVSILNCETGNLPRPEQPVFAEKWNRSHAGPTQPIEQIGLYINWLTITDLDGR